MSDRRTPLLIFGDGPRIPSGLARIARDLTARLVGEADELNIQVVQVGIDPPGGWQWQGWDFYGFQESSTDRGRGAVQQALEDLEAQDPIVWIITDPARGYDLTRTVLNVWEEQEQIDCEFWGYFPIDGENRLGQVGGPARECIASTDRLLAYGRYAAGVINTTLANYPGYTRMTAQPYLPHGIETRIFKPNSVAVEPAFDEWAYLNSNPTILKIGCVATNQPRKDLGLYFSTIAELKSQGLAVACWLQTDVLTKTWDIGELVRTCGLRRAEVFVSTEEITDQQLAARYSWSDVTIAPGLGEGFGYPIVESLACGTPCIHGNYAGGAELIPDPRWLVDPVAWRLESVYALLRPVYDPKHFARAVRDALPDDKATQQAYCAGAVSYLDWEHLWPRWRAWIRKGLHDHGTRLTEQPDRTGDDAPIHLPAL